VAHPLERTVGLFENKVIFAENLHHPRCETLAVNLTLVSRHGVLSYLSTTKNLSFLQKNFPFQKKGTKTTRGQAYKKSNQSYKNKWVCIDFQNSCTTLVLKWQKLFKTTGKLSPS